MKEDKQMNERLFRKNEFQPFKAAFLVFSLIILFGTSTAAFTADPSGSISQTTMVFYFGSINENYEYLKTDPLEFGSSIIDRSSALSVLVGGEVCDHVVWQSGNSSIATVDENGRVCPVGFGTTTITGTVNRDTYTCTVYVKEIDFYFWQEYTGEESSSRWAWDDTCCPCVGQSVPYKLIEITYGPDQKEESRKDVTTEYPLTAEAPDCVQVSPGEIKALKPWTSQEEGTSGVYHIFQNTGVDYCQIIRIHVFTSELYEKNYLENLCIGREDQFTLSLHPIDYTGVFTFDDEFIVYPGWSFYRFTPEELTWKSSNNEILTIEKVTGSIPGNQYSTATYSSHKTGTAEVSVELYDRKIASIPVTITCADFPFDEEPHTWTEWVVTVEPTSTTCGEKVRTCFACGATSTETIPLLTPETSDSPAEEEKETIENKTTNARKANTMTVQAKTVKVSYSKLKKKNQTITAKKAFSVKKAVGKVTFKKTSGSKKITVSKTGKLTVKKGLKKGKYKIKVKVTAAGNKSYKAKTKTVALIITVK